MNEKASYISEYTDKGAEYTALIDPKDVVCNDGGTSTYPGHRRRGVPSGPPEDHVLIRTAGNALQAIPRAEFEAKKQSSTVAVSMPSTTTANDEVLLVRTESQHRVVQATIPRGAVPGQTIFVPVPDASETPVVAPVVGVEQLHDLELTEAKDTTTSSPASDFVKVQVPEGYAPGSKLLVQVGPSESTSPLEVTVPADPTIREFYVNIRDAPKAKTEAYIV